MPSASIHAIPAKIAFRGVTDVDTHFGSTLSTQPVGHASLRDPNHWVSHHYQPTGSGGGGGGGSANAHSNHNNNTAIINNSTTSEEDSRTEVYSTFRGRQLVGCALPLPRDYAVAYARLVPACDAEAAAWHRSCPYCCCCNPSCSPSSCSAPGGGHPPSQCQRISTSAASGRNRGGAEAGGASPGAAGRGSVSAVGAAGGDANIRLPDFSAPRFAGSHPSSSSPPPLRAGGGGAGGSGGGCSATGAVAAQVVCCADTYTAWGHDRLPQADLTRKWLALSRVIHGGDGDDGDSGDDSDSDTAGEENEE